MADWQALAREEQQDILAYEIVRTRDRSEAISERMDALRTSGAKYEGYVAALLMAIWNDLP